MDKIVVRETSRNVFVELPLGQSIAVGDVLHPWQITELWSAAALANIGIYLVDRATVPSGKQATGYTFARVSGVVKQVLTLVDTVLTVSPRQIRLALSIIGLRQAVEDYVNAQDITVKDSWEYTTEFRSDNPLLLAGLTALGKTEDDLKSLFALASTL